MVWMQQWEGFLQKMTLQFLSILMYNSMFSYIHTVATYTLQYAHFARIIKVPAVCFGDEGAIRQLFSLAIISANYFFN